ncbi:MAG: NAD(+)/NADH kinase [Anaerolineales bacterium]|nr:NAD(+)/NADH kinase [Anaerolineales bacterium]
MITVGIIANPASGKDIRRLVAHGSVFDNDEKVSIVRRVLLGLEAVGVERVWIMPDSFGIGLKALHTLKLEIEVSLLDMRRTFSQEDSRLAAQQMVENGARCLVTLGGDGTNRIVAKASRDVPLMPISTGTNNVFPNMIEASIAGLATGLVACGYAGEAVRHAPQIDVIQPEASHNGRQPEVSDIALVDAAVYAERFIASRAIWDASKIRDVVLTRAEPGNIGLSSIGGHLLGGNYQPDQGVYLKVEPGNHGTRVVAPIGPGLIRAVNVTDHRLLSPGDEVVINHSEPCVLALDGEREIQIKPGSPLRLRLNANGPQVIDAHKAIELAAKAGFFIQPPQEGPD